MAELPILDLRGVGKTYELNGQSIEALRDANLVVRKGEFVCLIGASGCGKSTLLRIVAGFEPPSGRRCADVGQAGGRPRTRPRHGVPGLRPVPLADGAPEHRLRPVLPRAAEERGARHGGALRHHGGPDAVRRRASRINCRAA